MLKIFEDTGGVERKDNEDKISFAGRVSHESVLIL